MLEGRDWNAMDGASVQAIDALRAAAPDIPESYLHLLSFSNGGEGPLPINPFNLCLDPANEVTTRFANAQAEVDGFMIFGSNGGGEHLAFDTRRDAPWPIVTFDMVAGASSAQLVASDFDAFIDLIGIESPNA